MVLPLHPATGAYGQLWRPDPRLTLFRRFAVSFLPIFMVLHKQFNDKYGHVAGDDCLCGVTQVVQREPKRPSDMAFRHGGEEFACILAFANHQGAMNVAENIRTGVLGLAIAHERSAASPFVTVSLGVLTIGGSTVLSPQALLNIIDEQLYAVKEQGRNRVVDMDVSITPDYTQPDTLQKGAARPDTD